MSELFTHSPLPEHFNQNPAQSTQAAAAVPPPPPEEVSVSIRTMESDLELMAKSGGTLMPAHSLAQFAPRRPAGAVAVSTGAPSSLERTERSFTTYVWIAAGVAGIFVVFFVGYVILPKFLPHTASTTADNSPAGALSGLPAASSSAPSAAGFYAHTSLFTKGVDQTIAFSLDSDIAGQPYNFRLLGALDKTTASSSVIEVDPLSGGHPASWSDFLTAISAPVATPDFWTSRFGPDFSFFVYRTGGNFSAGYVLKAKDGQSPLILKNALVAVEAHPEAVKSLFIAPPKPFPGQFTDTLIAGQPARMLSFGTSTQNFYYGLAFNKYLILSTSYEGYVAAAGRL